MEDHKTILIVEDSIEDLEAAKRGFRRAGLRNSIVHCSDGDDALDYLHQRGSYASPKAAPRPAIVLLDLNLPGTDGREVLTEIRNNPALRKLPVIVLTTSRDERDIEACYSAGANTYIQKPVDLAKFLEAIARLKEYWLEIAVLPKP